MQIILLSVKHSTVWRELERRFLERTQEVLKLHLGGTNLFKPIRLTLRLCLCAKGGGDGCEREIGKITLSLFSQSKRHGCIVFFLLFSALTFLTQVCSGFLLLPRSSSCSLLLPVSFCLTLRDSPPVIQSAPFGSILSHLCLHLSKVLQRSMAHRIQSSNYTPEEPPPPPLITAALSFSLLCSSSLLPLLCLHFFTSSNFAFIVLSLTPHCYMSPSLSLIHSCCFLSLPFS